MTKRIAVPLGGLALFLWQFVAHMLTPLGDAGIQALPNEKAIQTAVKDTIREPGFYYFPAPEERAGMTNQQKGEAMQKAQERSVTEPGGIMIVYPNGRPFKFLLLLTRQLGYDFMAMLIAAVLLSQTVIASYGKRVLFVSLIGLIPTFTILLPDMNWYGFPESFTWAQALVHFSGFLFGGLAVAACIKPGK